MSKINLILFRFGASEPLSDDFQKMYEHKHDYEVVCMDDAKAVAKNLEEKGNGIFIFKISNKEDLQNAIWVLKAQRRIIKQHLFKAVALFPVSNPKVEKILKRYGCLDFFKTNLKPKALSFKVEFWSKPMFNTLEMNRKAQERKDQFNGKNELKNTESSSKISDFEFVDALDLESDVWLVKNKTDCKKILRRWLLKLSGPSLKVGMWSEIEAGPEDELQTWKFVPDKSVEDLFHLTEGFWFFYGSKPDFDWKAKQWSFSSEFPHLYFYGEDDVVYSRFKYKDNQVLVAKNSEFALTKEAELLKTCSMGYSISGGEHSVNGNMVGELTGDSNESSGNLSGKSSTDKMGEEALSGKSSTDKMGEAPLSGKSSTDKMGEEALSGKSSTDKMGEEALSGKSSTDKMGEAPLAGKSSTDKMGEAPLAGEVSTDKLGEKELEGKNNDNSDVSSDLLALENTLIDSIEDELEGEAKTDHIKNKNLASKKQADKKSDDSPLSGKSSTDKMGEAPLAGKSSTDKMGEAPLAGKSSTDKMGEAPLAGKSSTDKMGEAPLAGKSSTDKMGEAPLAGKSSTDKMGEAPLAGKSSTDKMGEAPLAGKSSTDKMGEAPLAGKSSTDKMGEAPLAGKSSTDKMGEAPLAGKSSTDKMGEAPLAGKSSTDKMGEAPLAGKSSTDKMGEAPLAGKSSTDKMGEAPLAGKSSTDKMGEAPLAGKSSTDKMGEAPLAGKSSTDKMGEAPLAGKSSTDKMGEAPLAGKSSTDKMGEAPLAGEVSKENEDIINDLNGLAGGGIEPSAKKEKEDHSNPEKSAFDLAKENASLKPAEAQHSTRTSMDNKTIDTQSKAAHSQTLGEGHNKSVDLKEQEMLDLLKDGDGKTSNLLEFSDGEDYFEEEDIPDIKDVNLESGELKVVLNHNTEVGNSINYICEFEDFYEDELIVKAPNDSLTEEMEVRAKVMLSYAGKNINVECSGKILEIEKDNESNLQVIVVELSKIDKKKYDTFMKLYLMRQESIGDFFKVAKG